MPKSKKSHKDRDITDSIDSYYNTMQQKYSHLNNEKFKKIYKKEDGSRNSVTIMNSKKTVFRGRYQVAGVVNKNTSIWHWGWNLPFIDRSLYKDASKIKDFANVIEKENEKIDPSAMEIIYFYCSNDSFFCSSNSIIRALKIVMYVTKASWFSPESIDENGYKMTKYNLIYDN